MEGRPPRLFVVAAVLSLSLATEVHAWKSALQSTHRPITVEGISLLQRFDNQYPDIVKYETDIADWSSGYSDDSAAHGANADADGEWPGIQNAIDYNGGPFAKWWEIVTRRYSRFRFSGADQSAYYYVGLMSHLLEDQAAPPHAANVGHGLGDDIEYWVWQVNPGQPEGTGVWYWAQNPKNPRLYFYDADYGPASIILQTQAQLPNWKYPDQTEHPEWYNLPYWRASATPYIGAAGDTNWGTYGGGEDIYLHNDFLIFYHNWSPEIATGQLRIAAEHTAGLLKTISLALPPLVRNFEIPPANASPATIDMVNGTNISFQVLENRTIGVRITIKAIDKAPPYAQYIVAGNGHAWNSYYDTLYARGAALPYDDIITLQGWKGEIAVGGTLPNGTYTMRIEVKDLDENEVNTVYPDINTDSIPENNTEHDFHIFTPPHILAPAKPTNPQAFGGAEPVNDFETLTVGI